MKRKAQVELKQQRKKAKESKKTYITFPMLEIDADNITNVLCFLDIKDILSVSSSCRLFKDFIDQNDFLWSGISSKYGMNFTMYQKLVPERRLSIYQLFKERLKTWEEAYGTVTEFRSQTLRENILKDAQKKPPQKLYKIKSKNTEEYLPIRSEKPFKDWYFDPSNKYVYLIDQQGQFSKCTKKGQNLTDIFKQQELRVFDILHVSEELDSATFKFEHHLNIKQLSTGKDLAIKSKVFNYIKTQEFMFILNLESLTLCLTSIRLSTGEEIKRVPLIDLSKEKRFANLSSRDLNASLSFENDLLVCLFENVIHVFQTCQGDISPIKKFDLPIEKFEKRTTSPILKTSLLNSSLIFRIGKKEIKNSKCHWEEPEIYSVNIYQEKVDWVIKEEKKTCLSLSWCLNPQLGLIVVNERNFIACYNINEKKLLWKRDDSDYENVIKCLDQDFGAPSIFLSTLEFELFGDMLIAYYSRGNENTGMIYDIKTGKNLQYLSISRNQKRVTTQGKFVSCKTLEFERENEYAIL